MQIDFHNWFQIPLKVNSSKQQIYLLITLFNIGNTIIVE